MAQLRQYQAEFDKLNTHITLVTFGIPAWVQAWLEETGITYPILRDEDLRAYRAFGLEQSMLRSYSPKTLLFYAKNILSGNKMYEGRGDVSQLGGDFIVDQQGILRYNYPSHTPVDRPEPETLLNILQSLD